MPSRLPDNYKSLVIQEWLNGEQRDKIAVDSGIGAGSFTNIVNEWRATLGPPTAVYEVTCQQSSFFPSAAGQK